MEKQLGWTTIEQSEKLIKAGLNPNTADMFYDTDAHGNKFGPFILIDRSYKEEHDRYPELTQPCWSLGTLIELMPKYIETKNLYGKEEECALQILPHNSNMVTYIDEVGGRFTYIKGENLFNNIFEMVIWLLEGGYIEKEETND